MQIAKSVDLRGTMCPLNFVKTKLALEQLEDGELLEVWIDAGEPEKNVPRSVADEGHEIVERATDAGACRMVIRKRG